MVVLDPFTTRRSGSASRISLARSPASLYNTWLRNFSGKVTYRVNPRETSNWYDQWSQKEQPNNFNKSLRYTSLDQTWTQPIRSWIYKGEWDGTLGRNMYAEARYGMSSVSASHVANNDTTAFGDYRCWPRNPIQNGPTKDQFIFRRRQFSGSLTYFKEGWGGSHEFKVGGVFDSDGRLERPPAGRLGQRPRDAEQRPAGQRDALRADGHIGRRPKGDVQPAQRRPG